ncbi:MAG: alpha/beta hydrolase [Acidimicrobiia bacterium]|nr:alpha/beta hydrolase [Acidimicrobiia bacterium]MDH5237383.1 alpha/beta hydrolase [Acidimicrobiia bacterium]
MRRRSWATAAGLILLAAGCGSDGSSATGGEAGVATTGPATTTTGATPTAAPGTTVPDTSVPDATVPETTAEPTTATPPTGITTGPTYEVDVTRDLVFGTGALREGEKQLMANLFVPVDAPGPHPVIVYIPGGGFQQADHACCDALLTALAERGLVAVTLEYRVQSEDPIPSERVGAIYDAVGGAEGSGLGRAIATAVEDSLLGIEWLVAQSDELDLDLDRVVVSGGSAGAITANHVAYTADDFDFERPPLAAVVDLWGGFTLANPSDVVTGDEPPVFIVHGTADNIVSYQFTEDLVAAADAAGLAYELHPVEGAGHGVDLMTTTADDDVLLFDHLVRWLQETLDPA